MKRPHLVSAAAVGAVICGLLTASAGSGALPVPPASAATPATTTALRTLPGTSGPDRLIGSNRADLILGRGGADIIYGRGGNDTISGGAGTDQLSGGAGADVLRGGYGADLILPGSGADIVHAGHGPDTIWLTNDHARDVIDCGPGADHVRIIGSRDPRDRFRRCESVRVFPSASAVPLALARIPWEGGPAYYKRFRNAVNWTRPSFFPIALWWGGISDDQDVAWDKSHGINTYINLYDKTDFSLIARHKMYWIGEKMNSTFKENSPYWVGNDLGDEIDGANSGDLPAGIAQLKSEIAQYAGNGKFDYTNFTSMVVQSFTDPAIDDQYVNLPNVSSLDNYLYTGEFCDWGSVITHYFITPLTQSDCRTASSYGKMVDGLRTRDASDRHLHPIWMFVENYGGGAPEDTGPIYVIRPAQLRGAVMNSIIHEARGIVYFNQAFRGSCISGNILHTACAAAQVAAMKTVDSQVKQLAPVINTQSYRWRFGSGLSTMVKTYRGYAYVFAMIDGTRGAGRRTFTLPRGISGKDVQVLFEGRHLTASNGRFTDDFPHEYSYHIYKIHL